MIDVIKQQFKESMSLNDKLNLTREFLQILCLKIMSDKNMFDSLAFVGGTCLRILYDLKRFSEDLDFSLIDKKSCDIQEIHARCVRAFELYGLPCEARQKDIGAVHSMMMKFPGLLKELGLSALSGQKLSIKWEVDTNPPPGGKITSTIINRYFMFMVTHHDLPSLFSGKLNACSCRAYTKGRDWYDFVWYLGRKVKPNFALLNHGMEQAGKTNWNVSEANFKDYLLDLIEPVDFEFVKKDVERFLEDKSELRIFEKDKIREAIKGIFF